MITEMIFILLNGFFVSAQIRSSLRPKFLDENTTLGPKIVGGRDAKIEEAPFFVTLITNFIYDEQGMCGGTYISGLWVLTAAHCFNISEDPEEIPDRGEDERVMLIMEYDETSKESEYDSNMFRFSTKLIIHPDANLRKNSPAKHDVALIKIDYPFNISEKAKIAILPERQFNYDGALATLVGWGDTDFANKQESPNKLQIVSVTVLPKDSCKEFKKYEAAICAGKRGQGSCAGDSGGPLIYKGIVIGITSYGVGGSDQKPCDVDYGVYENVYTHLSWIRKFVPDIVLQNVPGKVPSKSQYNRLSRSIISLCFTIEHLHLLLKTYNYV